MWLVFHFGRCMNVSWSGYPLATEVLTRIWWLVFYRRSDCLFCRPAIYETRSFTISTTTSSAGTPVQDIPEHVGILYSIVTYTIIMYECDRRTDCVHVVWQKFSWPGQGLSTLASVAALRRRTDQFGSLWTEKKLRGNFILHRWTGYFWRTVCINRILLYTWRSLVPGRRYDDPSETRCFLQRRR